MHASADDTASAELPVVGTNPMHAATTTTLTGPTSHCRVHGESSSGGSSSQNNVVALAPPRRPSGRPLGAAILATGMIARLRSRVRRSHSVLAKRIGTGLMACSVAHNVTLTVVYAMGQGELRTVMTLALSLASFLLHLALALAYVELHIQCGVHFGLLVVDALIRGMVNLARGELAWAAYSLGLWGFVLYPLGAWGLYRTLRATQNLNRAMRDAISHSAIVAFASSSMPIIYFCLNGLLCVAFKGDRFCAVRIRVNYAAILALLSNAMLFMLLTLQPVSLKQMTHLDLPTSQLGAFGFHGIVLLLALALHSQNENFGPVTPAIEYTYLAVAPCLILFMISFTLGIVQQSEEAVRAATIIVEARHADSRRVRALATRATQYGAMLPHRVVMASFTVLFLVLEACPVGEVIPFAVSPLSFAAASFHVWMRLEDAAVTWPVLSHFFVHASSAVIVAAEAWRDDERISVFIMLAYLLILYPALWTALGRFRSSVRAHGNESAANCAAVSFITFWGGIVPTMLYLGSDSLGTRVRVSSAPSLLRSNNNPPCVCRRMRVSPHQLCRPTGTVVHE